MPSNLHISDFLDPVNLAELSQDQGYKDGQIGKLIDVYDEYFPELEEASLVIVGCDEERGIGRDRRAQRNRARVRFAASRSRRRRGGGL